MTYSQAEKACKDKGKNYFLAMPKNAAEMKELNKALKYLIKTYSERVIWIGIKVSTYIQQPCTVHHWSL